MSAPPTAEQYKATKDPLLVTPGFKLGKDGLEKALEPRLRGVPGAKRVEVTARGKLVARTRHPPRPARPDAAADDRRRPAGICRAAAGHQSGSVVVFDCRTGEILAMVSMPAYDPNSFSDGISRCEWQMLSRRRPSAADEQDRCRGCIRPARPSSRRPRWRCCAPGSTRRRVVYCNGGYQLGNRRFGCLGAARADDDAHRDRAELQHLFLRRWRARSASTRSPPPRARSGFGAEVRPALHPPSATAPCPTARGSCAGTSRSGPVADTLNAAIGQGYVLASPFQLALSAARLASGRSCCQPTLLGRARRAPAPPALRARASAPSCARAWTRWSTAGGTGGRVAAAARRHPHGRQDRHRAGPPHHMAERARAARAALWKYARPRACSSASRPSTIRAMPPSVVIEHTAWAVRARRRRSAKRRADLAVRPRAGDEALGRAGGGLGRRHPDAHGGAGGGLSRARCRRRPPRPRSTRDALHLAGRRSATDGASTVQERLATDGPQGNTVAQDGTTEGRATNEARGFVPEPLAQLPWRIILLVLAIGGFGLVVLYSAAGGSITPLGAAARDQACRLPGRRDRRVARAGELVEGGDLARSTARCWWR